MPETDSLRILWDFLPSNQFPALSGTTDMSWVVVTDYHGITREFFSKIQLWSEGKFIDLTNPLLDGNRLFADGRYVHKTHAAANEHARKIVFDYEGSVYLINIPETTTFRDFIDAERK